jgi:hypothetical protein
VFSFIILHGFEHDRFCINENFRLKCNDTVLCISVGPRSHGLETRVIIKILTHHCFPRTFDCFSWVKAKKNGKIKIKNQKWPTQNTIFFTTVNSCLFYVKLSWIGPWFSRINWYEGHQCDSSDMVGWLSYIRPKTGFFFQQHFFRNPMKSSWRFLGSNDHPGFQPMRSWDNTYAQDCRQIFSYRQIFSCRLVVKSVDKNSGIDNITDSLLEIWHKSRSIMGSNS